MGIQKDKKLKNLLEHWPDGHVGTSPWLKKNGISAQLTQRYLKSGWIKAIGRGAYKKSNDQIYWHSGLESIQSQLGKNAHLGGPAALMARGISHYIRFGEEHIYIFHELNSKLPKWFLDYNWGNKVHTIATSLLPNEVAIKAIEYKGFTINASSPERGILECLYLAPKNFELLECYQLIESMQTLRPDIMQDLLERCNSVRVKRLFLYMAKKAELPIWKKLELNSIDLGRGDRAIVKNGVYNSEFKISIPKALDQYV